MGPPSSPVGRPFLYLGSRNLNVEPPFSPVGRTVYYFTILLFYDFISIQFQAEVFASRVTKPECRTTIFTGRPDRLLFTISNLLFYISFPFGSRQWFLHLGSRNLNVEPPFSLVGWTLPKKFLHLGQPILHVGSHFACRPNICQFHFLLLSIPELLEVYSWGGRFETVSQRALCFETPRWGGTAGLPTSTNLQESAPPPVPPPSVRSAPRYLSATASNGSVHNCFLPISPFSQF